MFRYVLLIAILSYEAQSAYVETNRNVTQFNERLAGIIKKKCLANANEAVSKKAVDALYTFQDLWQVALPKERPVGDKLYNYCLAQSENFTVYLETFMDELTPCLRPEEKYLKTFLLDSYGNYNHYFCKSLPRVNEYDSNKCDDEFDENHEPSLVCFKNSTIFGDNAKLTSITKRTFCRDISNIHTCTKKLYEKQCPSTPENEVLLLVLFSQVIENCLKSNNTI